MKTLSPETKGSLYAILSGLLYGLVGYFGVSLMESQLSIANMQFWRFLTSGIFIAIFIFRRYRFNQSNMLAMLKFFLAGALFYSTSSGIYFWASQYIGSGLSMVLLFTFPATVMLINKLLYKIHIPKVYYAAIVLIILGMAQLVDLDQMKMDMIGIGLALLAGLLYAFYIVASKKVQLPPMISGVMVSFGCAFAFFAYAWWQDSFMIPTTTIQWMYILGFGIISTAIPLLFMLVGLKKISAEKASLLSVLQPVFVVIFGLLLLEEALNVSKIFGIITILAGAVITLFSNQLTKYSLIRNLYRPSKIGR